MTTKTIGNNDDVIDSRDVIERLSELEDELNGLLDEVNQDRAEPMELQDFIDNEIDEDTDNADLAREYEALKKLADEAEGSADDWQYGSTLIRESYFTEYAQELAEDIGAVGKDNQWPLNHVDWEAAAEELKIDYTEVDFDGVTYYVR